MTPFLSLTANCILGFFVCWLEANLYDLPETTLTSEVHLTLAVLRLVLFLALVELSNLVILLRYGQEIICGIIKCCYWKRFRFVSLSNPCKIAVPMVYIVLSLNY